MLKQDPLIGALGLARKAGALLWGAERVEQAVKSRKAALVLLTADASQRTRCRLERLCNRNVACCNLELRSADLAKLTARPAVIFAVTDPNLAKLCGNYLSEKPIPQGGIAHGI